MTEEQQNVSRKKKLTVTITTPRGVKFVEQADMVLMRAIDGDFGVLPGHEPVTTVLGDGVLHVRDNGRDKVFALFEGIAEIDADSINIATTIAQRPDEIDLGRAEEDRLEAEAAVQEDIDDQISKGLQVMLTRALVRIRVGQMDYFDDDSDDDNESDN